MSAYTLEMWKRRRDRRCKVASPYEVGRRAGLADVSYLPHLSFQTAAEWIEFYLGWQAGKAERTTT